jgi:hypothetical protein
MQAGEKVLAANYANYGLIPPYFPGLHGSRKCADVDT